MKYVLDTNVVSRVLDGDESALGPLAQVEPQDVGIPLLVLAELLFGAERSARREENRKHATEASSNGDGSRSGAPDGVCSSFHDSRQGLSAHFRQRAP